MGKNLAKRTPADWRRYLEADDLRERVRGILPAHLSPERMAQLVLGEMARTPKIAECTTASVALAFLTCSQLGLEPSSPLGHVYLIPYKIKGVMTLTVLVGYKGMLELARRTGQVAWAHADVVYEDEIARGAWRATVVPPAIAHDWQPDVDRDPKKLIAAYCIVRTKDGAQYQTILTRAQIDARRKRSRAKDDGPWVTDFAAMARKSAVRALLTGGSVPLSAEVMAGLSNDADSPEQTAEVELSPAQLDQMVADVLARRGAGLELPNPEMPGVLPSLGDGSEPAYGEPSE